ncbi:ATP-dependent DNA helicase RecG [candidate division KSB1 bacterium]|nr:ATP-dependent DNA helicase RecG [candidate division KSB1 bacterium]
MAAQPQHLLAQPVEQIPTIGPKRAAALKTVNVRTLEDLLYYFPRRYLDRSLITKVDHLTAGIQVTVVGRVERYGIKHGRKNRFVLVVTDGTGYLSCIWFNRLSYWSKVFKEGEWLALSGKVTYFGGFQMTHPEFDRLGEEAEGEMVHTGKIIPMYPSSETLGKVGLDSRGFRRLFYNFFKEFRVNIEETLPDEVLKSYQLVSLPLSLTNIHFPSDQEVLDKARYRLKFEELFFLELLMAYRKHQNLTIPGIQFKNVGEYTQRLAESLPFELTNAQKKVLHEIRVDMRREKAMNRLLLGDVGSGKTVIALFVMLIAVDNNYQAALMAPTEILAEQHFLNIHQMLEQMGVHVVLLVGGQSRSERLQTLQDIEAGKADIIVGTHAVIQQTVNFSRLGLVCIDEQHRFGVLQRAELRQKGGNPDVLIMTATPIPRTLAMTVYGDLDVSVLDELPSGRRPIITTWRPEKARPKIYDFVKKRVDAGDQIYVVFPLVEESEKMDLKAATDSYEIMKKTVFSEYSLGLLHGRMKSEEKEAVMSEFKRGKIQILVSTTVIEVGVDVANASCMVVEHAERFGLTQLHQLRGRVGRGGKQSYCILVSYGRLSDDAKKRLDAMEATTDGFRIAEMDLKLRGPGEFFGTRQSGLPDLRLADVVKDFDILQKARNAAFELVENDPNMAFENHHALLNHFVRKYRDSYNLAGVG